MLMNCHDVHTVPHNDILERKRTRRVHKLFRKQGTAETGKTKEFCLDRKVKHLEDQRHQYLIAFGVSVPGFQARIIGQDSV